MEIESDCFKNSNSSLTLNEDENDEQVTYMQHLRQAFHIECFAGDNTANDISNLNITMIICMLFAKKKMDLL